MLVLSRADICVALEQSTYLSRIAAGARAGNHPEV
jgi:hypothetical protein